MWFAIAVCCTHGVAAEPADSSASDSESAGALPESLATPTLGSGGPWDLPAPGSCRPQRGLRGWPLGSDAPPIPFRSGDTIALEQLEALHDFIPAALWEQREKLFFEGMRLQIGGCFADYSPPDFYLAASQKFAGTARLAEDGGLEGYTAGQPFVPGQIAADDPDAGLKWAWNFEQRYQAAGFQGDFRTTDMLGRMLRAEPFIGEIFKLQLSYRSDRTEDGFTAPGSKENHWVSGGSMKEPFDARHYAWRQYRDVEHLVSPDRSDDIHAYDPGLRRVRRVSGAGVEGLYMPAFNLGAVKPTAIAAGVGGGLGGVGGGAAAISGGSATIVTKRSGFEGLELRPLLYEFNVLGIQDVLAPINSNVASYPEDPERDFGPWGLSYASDTWDLRRAIVLEGRSKRGVGGDRAARLVLYLDLQTLYPLYYMSWDSKDEPIDVGSFIGRWSEAREGYPPWPDDATRSVRVIDPVGAAFTNLREGGGWRRESWTIVSIPPSDRQVKRLLSVRNLTNQR